MIRLGRKFLLPEYPSTRAEARPYRRMARRSLIEIYDAESEPLKHFERQFNRAFDPLQIPSVERGGVEKSMAALDRAGSDAVETCNRAALEESLDILREAIRFAHSSHNLTQNSGAKALNETPASVVKPTRPEHGPAPDKHSWTFERIVNKVAEGSRWKDPDNLEDIGEKLDREKVPLPQAWRKWSPRSWKWAAKQKPGLVVKLIEQRLKMARYYAPPTPPSSEPSEL